MHLRRTYGWVYLEPMLVRVFRFLNYSPTLPPAPSLSGVEAFFCLQLKHGGQCVPGQYRR